MIKQQKSSSWILLSVIVVLMSLLLLVNSPANAWFQIAHHQGIRFDVQVGDLMLELYQDSVSENNLVYTTTQNT